MTGAIVMKSEANKLRQLIRGMRAAYAKGDNAMAYARDSMNVVENNIVSTLISYDLQAGSYVARVEANPQASQAWCSQAAESISQALFATQELRISDATSILELGTGECTTLAGVLDILGDRVSAAYGLDLSWSRIQFGRQFLKSKKLDASLFVGDLFQIPMNDRSVDVVFTSHSLEPNRGRELDAIKECLRVARRAVVLIEPIFELASSPAQARMTEHGYVRGLKDAASSISAAILDYRLLPYSSNPLNPSGVIILGGVSGTHSSDQVWRCPLTGAPLMDLGDVFYSSEVGIGYPVVRQVPMLRPEHGIVLTHLGDFDHLNRKL